MGNERAALDIIMNFNRKEEFEFVEGLPFTWMAFEHWELHLKKCTELISLRRMHPDIPFAANDENIAKA